MSNIVVPELGESVVEARIAKWLKKPGDSVAVGEAVVELETEKIDLEVSAERSGVSVDVAVCARIFPYHSGFSIFNPPPPKK